MAPTSSQMPYKDPDYMRKYRRDRASKISAYNKAYAKAKPRNRKGKLESSSLKRYGLNVDAYLDMVEAQHGVCAVCKNPETARRKDGASIRLSVDHDHTTDKVRGLLCQKCNAALGLVNDKQDLLQALISYLEQYTA